MRLAVTVVSVAAGLRADVVIDADPATPVAQVAAGLDRLLHGEAAAGAASGRARVLHFPRTRTAVSYAGPGIPGYGSGFTTMAAGFPAAVAVAPALFVAYQQVAANVSLAESPIRDGVVVSVGDPAGCMRPEPAGVAEIRVASGPAAGALHRLPFGEADIGGATPGQAPRAGRRTS